MTIDERIQALTMNLELLTQMHQDFERRMTDYAEGVRDAIDRLSRIAGAHETRISDLEEGK